MHILMTMKMTMDLFYISYIICIYYKIQNVIKTQLYNTYITQVTNNNLINKKMCKLEDQCRIIAVRCLLLKLEISSQCGFGEHNVHL